MYPAGTVLGLARARRCNDQIVGGYWPEAAERSTFMWEALSLKKGCHSGLEHRDCHHSVTVLHLESTRCGPCPRQPR